MSPIMFFFCSSVRLSAMKTCTSGIVDTSTRSQLRRDNVSRCSDSRPAFKRLWRLMLLVSVDRFLSPTEPDAGQELKFAFVASHSRGADPDVRLPSRDRERARGRVCPVVGAQGGCQ